MKATSDIRKDSLDFLVRSIEGCTVGIDIENLSKLCFLAGFTGHLAILTQPYLDLILERKKTIESRFSKNRCPPFRQISPGDVVLLKESSGPLRGVVIVTKTLFFGPLDSKGVDSLFDKYSKDLCVDSSFRELKRGSRYATLISLGPIARIQSVDILKSDRRGWVVLRNERQMQLFE